MITCSFENANGANLRHVTVNCLVVQDGKLLLGKRAAGLLEAGKWGPLGGFMDRDETTEQAAVREVFEESGWNIRNLRLLRINDDPNRPNEDRQNVDFTFIAEAVEQSGKKDWENDEIQWFRLDALPPDAQIAFDHAENIALYRRWLDEHFSVPVIGSIK